MKITLDDINTLKKELSELPVREDLAISSIEAVKLMINEITELQQQGYKLKEIHSVITNKGINISERTFAQYVAEAKKNKPKKTKPRSKNEQKAPMVQSEKPTPQQKTTTSVEPTKQESKTDHSRTSTFKLKNDTQDI